MSVYLSLDGPQIMSAGPLVNVSNDNSFGQSGMAIEINPANPLQLAGIVQHVGAAGAMNEIDVYRSADAGRSWAKTAIDNGAVGIDDGTAAGVRFDPSIAFDDAGNLYVAYGNDTGTSTSVIVGRSADGGTTFSQFRTIAQTTDIHNGAWNEVRGNTDFSLAAGPDGLGGQAVYVAYIKNVIEGGPLDARVTIDGSHDGGASWLGATTVNNGSISGTSDGNLAPDVAVGGNGQVYLTWQSVNIETGQDRLLFDRDLDGRFISSGNFGLDGTIKSFASGSLLNWIVPASPERGVDACPTLAVDRSGGPRNGSVYVAYTDWVSGSDTDVRVLRSLTGAGSWTDFPVGNSPGTDFEPTLSIDQHSGAVAIGYYSSRNDVASGNDDVQPILAVSTDGFASINSLELTNQKSNETGGYTGDYSDHIGVAMRDGTAHVMWASRHGAGTDLDAFTTTVGLNSTTNHNVLTVNDTYLTRVAIDSGATDAFFYTWGSGPWENPPMEFAGLGWVVDQLVINGSSIGEHVDIMSLPANVSATINSAGGNDQINVWSLWSGTSVTVNGGANDDLVTLGAYGYLSDVDGHVTVNNDAGSDSVYLRDANANNSDSFLITESSVAGSGFGGLSYSGLLGRMTLVAGTGANTITVDATNYNLQLDIDAGAGTDWINIGSSRSLGAIVAPVHVLASTGADVISVNDLPLVPYITGTNYHLTGTTLTRQNFGGLTYDGAAALNLYAAGDHDTINVDGTAAGTAYYLHCNGYTSLVSVNDAAPSAPVHLSSAYSIDTIRVNTDDTNTASLQFTSPQYIGTLTIGNGGSAQVAPGGDKRIVLTALDTRITGTLDLTDNDLIVDYSGPFSQYTQIQRLIAAGRNGGTWTGKGITSSSAKVATPKNKTLGVMEATDFKGIYGPGARFAGEQIDNTAVLVKYTYYGDADFNGVVDFDDYSRIDAGFSTNRTGWLNGDFDGNDAVNFDDYSLIDLAFNTQGSVPRSNVSAFESKGLTPGASR